MKTITVQCPDELHSQIQDLVQAGWLHSSEDAVLVALRRFLETHHPEVLRQNVLKDVEWGLHGRD